MILRPGLFFTGLKRGRSMNKSLKTERVSVKRLKDRGAYDIDTIYSILDEGKICHVGFVVDGQPYVIPMAYARINNKLILHGSVLSRLLNKLASGIDVCVTVTLVDGMVLARSAFHHSMNYRSVVILGKAKPVIKEQHKAAALDELVDHLIPGRSQTCRPGTKQELKATHVLEIQITEASVKQRFGPPKDDKEDMRSDYWAGVIPMSTVYGQPEAAADLKQNVMQPDFSELTGEYNG